MKKTLIFIIVLSLLFSYKKETESYPSRNSTQLFNTINNYHTLPSDTLRIMTYNLLSHEIGFDGISSDERKSDTISLINAVNPHVLCLQEMSFDFFKTLRKKTLFQFTSPVSTFLSCSMTVLLYNPNYITLIEDGLNAYHYSTNPRLRSYTWGLFMFNKTKSIFLVVNTHLNLYEQVYAYPLLQVTELVDFCREKQNKYKCPIYISGDFNSQESNEATINSAVYDYISLFYNDSKEIAESKTYGIGKSINAPLNDYIFCCDNTQITNYTILSQPELNLLSDHFPVFIDINTS